MASITRWSLPALFVGGSLFSGCAHVNTKADYRRVANEVRDATNMEGGLPDDESLVVRRVDEALQEGLTVDEAVQLCLINNPALRAEYATVGIARAEVVQSGLFSNPTLAFSAQFPEGGGRSNIQASLAQNIVDLWQIPVRRRAAQAALDEAILRLARSAAQLFVDAKVAYFQAVAADQSYAIARENQSIAQRLLDAAVARQRAGVVSELDVNLNRQTVLAAQLESQQARLDAASARRKLGTLLGLTLHVEEIALTTPLPDATIGDVDESALLTIAIQHRLDLRAARAKANAAAGRVELEIRKIIPEFTIGPMLERNERRALPGRKLLNDTARSSLAGGGLTAPDIEPRSQRNRERSREIDTIFGPAFSLTLPIFDQNQAQIARAKFECEQAFRQVDALEREIVQEIRQALDQARTAGSIVRFYEQSLLPQVGSNLELSRGSYEKGATSILIVLDAQRSLLATRRAVIAARQAAATSLAQLERVTAQPLSALPIPLETHSTTQPSNSRNACAKSLQEK